MTNHNLLRALGTAGVLLMSSACSEPIATPTSASTSPVSETFASRIAPRGTASRAFSTSAAGTVTVTLTSVAPEARVGVGVGIPLSSGTSCNLSESVESTATGAPQITTTAESGSYCVKIFDAGALTEPVNFSVTILHP